VLDDFHKIVYFNTGENDSCYRTRIYFDIVKRSHLWNTEFIIEGHLMKFGMMYILMSLLLFFSVGGTRPGSKNSITGVLPIDNIYDSDHILTLDTTFFWAKNADRPINIWRDTLSDSSNEFIHPGISYRVRKFGADPGDIIFGYDSTKGDTVTVIAKSGSPKKYLIGGFTPYPNGNGKYEDIYLRWSDDFQNWTIPFAYDSLTGHKIYVNDPIIGARDIHPVTHHLADPEYIIDKNGQTWMIFIAAIDSAGTSADRQKIMAIRALNDISWRVEDTVTIAGIYSTNTAKQFLSPSLVIDTTYRIYCIYKNPDSKPYRQLVYFRADSMTGPWTGPIVCSLKNADVWQYYTEATPWHVKVRKFGHKHIAMITPYTAEPFDSVSRGCLWMAVSDNGIDFTVAGRPVLCPKDFKSARFDGERIYRSDFIPGWTSDGAAFDILYSCHGTDYRWYTAHTRLHFNRRGYQKLRFESINAAAYDNPERRIKFDRDLRFMRVSYTDTLRARLLWRDSCMSADGAACYDTISARFEPEQWVHHLDSFIIILKMPGHATPDSAAISKIFIMGPKNGDNIDDSLIWSRELNICANDRKFTRMSFPVDLDIDPDKPYSFHIQTKLRSQKYGAIYCRSMHLIASEE